MMRDKHLLQCPVQRLSRSSKYSARWSVRADGQDLLEDRVTSLRLGHYIGGMDMGTFLGSISELVKLFQREQGEGRGSIDLSS